MHDGAITCGYLTMTLRKAGFLNRAASAAKTYDKIGILGPKVYYYHDTQKIFCGADPRWSGGPSLGQKRVR